MWLASRFLHIRDEETTVARRGFRVDGPATRARLEGIGLTFLSGYHAALELPQQEARRILEQPDRELRGFAYEGAAMAYCLLDILRLQWVRFPAFVTGIGAPHTYMAHVGAGWALARVPWVRTDPARFLKRFDPLLRWLVIDGYGFHDGYFHWPQAIGRQAVPKRLAGYARRAYDHGLGRSLWFVEGANAQRIRKSVAAFDPQRHSDLWAGVGLACAYAGGGDANAPVAVREAAGDHWAAVAQGAAFAAACRERAGNPAPRTDTACRILCGCSARAASEIAVQIKNSLPPDTEVPAYEAWRRRIQRCLSAERTAA